MSHHDDFTYKKNLKIKSYKLINNSQHFHFSRIEPKLKSLSQNI